MIMENTDLHETTNLCAPNLDSHCPDDMSVPQRDREAGSPTGSVCVCEYCGRAFKTARGLGQHKAKMHQAELNSERADRCTGRRTRWSKQEDEALVRNASELWETCSSLKEMYAKLTEFFSGRSEEALKKRLQLLNWRPPTATSPPGVRELGDPVPAPADVSMADECKAWQELMRGHILENLDRCSDGKLQSSCLRDLVADWSSEVCDLSAAQRRLQELVTSLFPYRMRLVSKRYLPAGAKGVSRRSVRKAQYAQVQKLYWTNRKDWASTVLSGEWRSAHVGGARTVDGLHDFWANLLSQPSSPDLRPVEECVWDWPLLAPLAAEEVTAVLKEMGTTAPGLDKLTAKELLSVNAVCLAQLLNTMLLLQTPTSHLAKARLTLVPKKGTPEQPGDFRPIAVSSVLLRLLHKVLARRWRSSINLNPWQLAFQQRDGCLEASSALHCVLRNAHSMVKPLAAAFIDVAKAFDTVSHETILRVARSQGLPPPLQEYLRNLYDEGEIQVGVKSVRCGRGVRQGDPLSPLLFISVMDEVLRHSMDNIGIEVNGCSVSHLLYADDLVIFAENECRLQERLSALDAALSSAGMQINALKSKGLTLVKDGKRKCLILKNRTYHMGAKTIPPMSVSETVTYLGLQFTWKGRVAPNSTRRLGELLREIKEAPLKPRQRLLLLRVYAVPKLMHELTLGFAHRNTLIKLDRLIRDHVRKWMRLPKDTSIGFLHTAVRKGGLGIPCLSAAVPLAQKARVEKLLASQSLPAKLIVSDASFATILRAVNRPVRLGNRSITTALEAQAIFEDRMVESRDCCKLAGLSADPASFKVMADDSRLAPGLFLRGTWLRAGVLNTKARRSRGDRLEASDRLCKSRCGQIECIDHILQTCAATHAVRCERHNRVAKLLARRLRKRGREVLEEPIIPMERTFCKPDLLVRGEHELYVMDVCIAAPNLLELSWRLKREKYANDVVHGTAKNLFNSTLPVLHLPVVLSNRGHLYSRTGNGLRKLGLSGVDLMDLCSLTIAGSLKCYDVYTRGLNS